MRFLWVWSWLLVVAVLATRGSPINEQKRLQLEQQINQLVADNRIMIFSKSSCKWCKKVKALLATHNLKFKAINLDTAKDGMALWDLLEEMTGQKTVPNVFIRGKHVGGCDAVTQLHQKGQLAKLLMGRD